MMETAVSAEMLVTSERQVLNAVWTHLSQATLYTRQQTTCPGHSPPDCQQVHVSCDKASQSVSQSVSHSIAECNQPLVNKIDNINCGQVLACPSMMPKSGTSTVGCRPHLTHGSWYYPSPSPNGTSIGSATSASLTTVINRHTDHTTSVAIGSILWYVMQPHDMSKWWKTRQQEPTNLVAEARRRC